MIDDPVYLGDWSYREDGGACPWWWCPRCNSITTHNKPGSCEGHGSIVLLSVEEAIQRLEECRWVPTEGSSQYIPINPFRIKELM